MTYGAELTQLFREVIAQRSSSEWMAVFQANDVLAKLRFIDGTKGQINTR